jgi:hypothetical protein
MSAGLVLTIKKVTLAILLNLVWAKKFGWMEVHSSKEIGRI